MISMCMTAELSQLSCHGTHSLRPTGRVPRVPIPYVAPERGIRTYLWLLLVSYRKQSSANSFISECPASARSFMKIRNKEDQVQFCGRLQNLRWGESLLYFG